MDDYVAANRDVWDDWTQKGCSPASFKIDAFRAGHDTLQPFEIEELGNVDGKTLLHLQCHFGLDTLCWARRGARATGVDFSPKAIERAQVLAAEIGVDARFICSDVGELPRVLTGNFDIVYTSFGVLAWMPDLTRWADVVAHFTRPEGTFYIAEYHPITFVMDDDPTATEPRVRYPYWPTTEPIALGGPGGNTQYGWPFSMGGVLTNLAEAGFRIEWLHEFPFSESQHLPYLEPADDGTWRLPRDAGGEIPLMFSLRATKET
ncbi:MAG: class I SAM-dependent methyltransferase [Actinomycetota bacterium]